MNIWWLLVFAVSWLFAEPIDDSSIQDPRAAALENPEKQELKNLQQRLKQTYEKARKMEEGNITAFQMLLKEVKEIREKIYLLRETMRGKFLTESMETDEEYALWDVGEIPLPQLIMEYGASDFLYIIPQDLSNMKITLFSSIPLPRDSWDEMIEAILMENGVGVKRINPYVKQLYILKTEPLFVEGVVDQVENLDLFADHARLFFLLSPAPDQVRSIQSFFERFSDPKQTAVQAIGSKLAIISTRSTIEKLLGIYKAVWEKDSGKIVEIVNLTKISSQEAEKVLKALFAEAPVKGRPPFYQNNQTELATLPLPQGLVLIGDRETVKRGVQSLKNLEEDLEDPSEKVVYWYTCKHSTPEEIASVLEKVYDSLIDSTLEKKGESKPPSTHLDFKDRFHEREAAFQASQPETKAEKKEGSLGRFVVDAKTNSILMVVRREELAKVKELLKKLDVPKKMVQLDVLLVEKRLTDRKQVGFNVLQLGRNDRDVSETAVSFNTDERALNKGILGFMFSRPKGNVPAMNIAYNFLLAQDDVRINANPSVLTVNQTPATVSIVEEISINNGAVKFDASSTRSVEQSYTRAQYGITIELTPTIHLPDADDENAHQGFVTLQTNLQFDTTQAVVNDRPPVTRRHIENEVCVADGETVVLGGLRRKIEEGSQEKIPFLGDLPGFGKLFGSSKSTDTNTEMFIFITPHIIRDPVRDLKKIKLSECQKRAGDLPEFLDKLEKARAKEKGQLFEKSLQMLWDMYP